MKYDWLIDRGREVALKTKGECELGLEKYDKIALMFYNSVYDGIFEVFIIDESEEDLYYNIIHRLCSIPGIGLMAYLTGFIHNVGVYEKKEIAAHSRRFVDIAENYYNLEKLLSFSDIYLYSINLNMHGAILRYGRVSNSSFMAIDKFNTKF